MKAIRLIARRDWVSTILSPTGLIIVGLYLVVSGYVFWLSVTTAQEATLRGAFVVLGYITALVVPLLSMRLLSEELRSGTFELLASHPVSDVQIVLGKYLAGLFAFLALSTPTLSYILILQVMGTPDWGPALCTYLGQLLLAAMLLAMGLLASALTANQVLAAMAATIGGIVLAIAGAASYSVSGWMGRALAYLAMFEHFSLFRRGILDTRALTYFLATTGMFLYLSVRAVESRRWKFGVLPSGVTATWMLPRLGALLLIVAGVVLTEAVASTITRGIWSSYNTVLTLAGIVLAGTPVYLNRHRLRYELSRRRIGLIITVGVNSLLVLTIWVLLTYFTSTHFVRMDLTSSKHYALSEQTRLVLSRLDAPVEMIIAMSQQGGAGFQEVDDLLAEYKAQSSRVSVQAIDPLRNPGDIEQARQRFKLTSPPSNEVLVAYGDQVKRVPVASLVNQKTIVVNGRAVAGPAQFVGEAEITSAIIQLTTKSPGRIAFLGGHAERDLNEQGGNGASFVASQLRRNGWVVDRHIVAPGANASFPEGTSVVIVAGPQKALADEDLKALQDVLDRGGGVLALVDPGANSGLEPLFQNWDVRLANDIVVDLRDHVASADATSLYVTHFRQEDPIGKGMGSLAAVLPTARPVGTATTQVNMNVYTSRFMFTSNDGWAIAYKPGTALQIDQKRDRHGSVSLGMSCTRYQAFPEPGRQPLTGRLVVIGDSDFMTNQNIDLAGNLNLFLNSVDWLAGRQELISVRPKVTDIRRMALTETQMKTIFWLSVIAVPGATMLLGLAAIGRRRYRA